MLEQKFIYKQMLGEGSFGTVSLVEFQNGSVYALKQIKVNPFVIEQSLKQIKFMTQINHKHVINIYDSKYDDKTQHLYILMEYCKRGDLQSYIIDQQKKLSVQDILNIVRQITNAFIMMNINGIIHRDLKPQNILITDNQMIKVADFGCATNLQQQVLSKLYIMSYDKGTANYSSPQQLMGKPYSARCDVWALGCLVYYLYFNEHPFSEITVAQTLNKIEKLTQNNRIIINKQIDKQIKKLLQLSLVFSDTERASWRQISLSRVLQPQISDIQGYLSYLCSLTNLGNWITKQFWKARKRYKIQSQKNYIFAYFMIKYQYSNMKMAMDILNKSNYFSYMFKQSDYHSYCPTQQIIQEIMADLEASQNYFKESKVRLQKKSCYRDIEQKDCRIEHSVFADLDNSIKICYKILKSLVNHLEDKSSENPQGYQIEPVWVVMAQWINFEVQLQYQKKINFFDFFKQIKAHEALNQIKKHLEKYQAGIIIK